MSIAAIIMEVVEQPDRTVKLILGPIAKDDGPGQRLLTVLNPPGNMNSSVGTRIWGGDSYIMIGETKWAERVGYTSIRLIDKKQKEIGP